MSEDNHYEVDLLEIWRCEIREERRRELILWSTISIALASIGVGLLIVMKEFL